MRKYLFFLGLLLLLPLQARAQKVELFGGYSYQRLETAGVNRSNMSGWNLALQVNANPILGFVGDFSGHYGTREVAPGVDKNINTHAMFFGPRVRLPGPVRPFAHALFGVARGSAGVFGSTDSESAFGMVAGGGVDADIGPLVSWRIIQADYVMNRFFDRNNNNFRLATGLVIRF